MPELRRDPLTGRWVAIATERRKRPNDFRVERMAADPVEQCPFCPGHEDMTPPEIFALRPEGSVPNGPGWNLRVVPNRFPALRVEGALDRQGHGLFDRMNGIGAHEVIIETPEHAADLASMDEHVIVQVLAAWRERMLDLERDQRLRYVIVFKNQGGTAGATLDHPHSQLIALPIVPDIARREIDGARKHYADHERCIFCDIIRQEIAEAQRVIAEDQNLVALAPWASRLPFETWFLPRHHGAQFEEAPRSEYESLARMLKGTVARMNKALASPPFNLIVHTAPFAEEVGPFYHWHVELMPKLSRVAGFEWGTGFYINPTSPEEAAQVLRAAAP
ncbi:MAG: galactose-1-phosphate uridylyltransferase [Acidobacteria bacterium]|nr:galactose-1-phosphate uridylyltransferase [Acidobacteriota bacterium]